MVYVIFIEAINKLYRTSRRIKTFLQKRNYRQQQAATE